MTIAHDFERDGHALVREIATPGEIEAFRPVIAGIVNDVSKRDDRQGRIDDYSKLFTQVTNVWRIDSEAREIVFHRRFAAVAASLLGVPSVRLYHDQALFKPPGSGATPWHQDRYYWPLDTDRTVTMWLPLGDVSEDMGPMIFASGSHRATGLGELAISDATSRRLAGVIEERGWSIRTDALRAGDATFHAGATLHSAGANRSGRVREVLTIIYYAAGTRVAGPANENQRVDLDVFIPGARPGDEAASELNPVLYP
ncbi:MAG TPA: phytanoyl-CoA dioxygenase family protein [Thermoanaerobaculia bacterium]|nr:phytanoyl-CoA dioxygenase family protein [Thermoanaerobaculia bacterium]